MKTKVKGMRSKNMDKLIAAVQIRECLWDKSYRGHRNRFKLERYWNEVAAEVGTTSKLYCISIYFLSGAFVAVRHVRRSAQL